MSNEVYDIVKGDEVGNEPNKFEMTLAQVDPNLVPMESGLCVSFEPDAIRAHFEGDDPDPTEGLSDEQLRAIGYYAIGADSLWSLFHELLVEAINDYQQGLVDA